MISFGYKFRIFPTEEQKEFFEKHFGCCRFVYNYLLALRKEAYEKLKITISGFEAKKEIARLKRTEGYTWLKDVNSQSLQESSLDLEKAYRRFFKKLGSAPRFKKKFHKQTFKVPQFFGIKKTKRDNVFLCIPKLKSAIKVNAHREINGEMKQVVIVKEASGEYFASFNCEVKEEKIFKKKDSHDGEVGIDLGLTSFIATSTGEKKEQPRFFRKKMQRLKLKQRSLSRKKKYSLNWHKNRKRVSHIHQKIVNSRKDFLHKISFKLVDENQVIYLEDLNVKGMMRNRRLSKSIMDASWSEFVRQLKYKVRWRGKKIVQVGRFEPTSKLCSFCGFKNNELQLHQREWSCSKCNRCHDRDINAAKNIVKLGQDMSKVKPVEKATAVFSFKKKQVDSVKQEPNSEVQDAR